MLSATIVINRNALAPLVAHCSRREHHWSCYPSIARFNNMYVALLYVSAGMSAIIEEIRADHARRYPAPRHEAVEAGRVRDYLLALNEPAEHFPSDPVPNLFLLTLGRTRRPQPSRGTSVNAGDEYEFLPRRL
jgi:hypothetical protein